MADSGKQSPLGINVVGSYLQNQGLTINPVAASYMGASKTNSDYTFGSLVSSTALSMLTYAINDGYNRGQPRSVFPNGTTLGAASLITGCPYEILKLNNDTLTATAITPGEIYKIASIGTGSPVNAGSFVIGQTYGIKTVGTTNFTLIGASSNTVGVVFTATGIGSGSGDAFLNPTDFTLIGASSNTVDTVFTATGVGTGTGTVTYNGTLPVVAITPGKLYQIKTVGSTDFTDIGSPNNTVGTIFTATGVGIGTGTVTGGITDFTKVGATKVTAGNFIPGEKYIIFTLGSTNFTSIGASGNTVGLIFTATGVGTGTGEAITVNFTATGTGTGTGTVSSISTLTNTAYNNLISIGANTIPALGNAKPPTYVVEDPSGIWTDTAVEYGISQGESESLPGPATSGYGETGVTGQGQEATWLPYNTTNPNSSVTQWGYLRLHALQAWNEFNWNGTEVSLSNPEYKEFLSSFTSAQSFIDYNNQAIMTNQNSKTFLDGSYSNMDDLISADIYGISLANTLFGTDLENLGKVINLSRIDSFGLPSVLLQTLGENNAVVQDLVLALLSSGLESSEVQGLISGSITTPTVEQEQQIYSAFLIIIGENLEEVLAPLQCTTQGLDSLADLLDVKKLFPNSYESLTVPKYNSELGLPTNSKTYYPIYLSGGVNPALTTPDMNDYVGTQTPNRPPNITRNPSVSANNISSPKKGFGSYLFDILPKQQAVASGAFSFTTRQVKNIDRVDIKNFSRAVKSIENTRSLNLVNGTSKPTNDEAIANVQTKEALGSGPYGTYTMSDFFGCMSGLPYAWQNIYNNLAQLETSELYRLYKELYLAVSWEPAKLRVQYTGSPGSYTVTGVTIVDGGGGYGRGGAPAPTITLSNGGTAVATIGTDTAAAGSNGTGAFGRVTTVALTSPGSTSSSIPTVTIQAPPTSTSGGTNTASGTTGWATTMSTVVQNYIDLANAEIDAIFATNNDAIRLLNTYWNVLGSQLAIEQRSRYIGLSPVPVPKDPLLNPYPTSINNFVDNIPTIAQDTRPHMAAQTLESICNLNTLGGQSTVALMRQERNQQRLNSAGIPLDTNISGAMSSMDQKTLTTNNTIAAGINNVIESPIITLINASPEVYGNVTNGVTGFTNPAWSVNEFEGQTLSPVPSGVYIPSDTNLLGEFIPALSDSLGGVIILDGNPPPNTARGDISPILNGEPVPVVNTFVPTSFDPIAPSRIVTITAPNQLDTNVPFNLDPDYTSSTMLPASYSINEAIDKVIECNCDCWVD